MNNLNFKDIIAKIKALPTKTKNIILLILGIVIFIAAYMLGFQKIQEKTAAVQEEVNTQAAYVNELKNYYNNIQTYEKGIEEAKDDIEANVVKFPAGINTEDMLMYVKILNETIGGNFQNISFEDSSFLGEFSCVINEKSVTVQPMHTGASFQTYMTYAQVKETLKYIYEQTPELTILNSVSLNYNAENAFLDCKFDISKFYITYDGSEYVPVPVPDVELGVADPFGTASGN